MDKHETKAKYNLAETCVASISSQTLQELSEDASAQLWDPCQKLNYGSIRGTDQLRSNLASLYSARTISTLSPDSILITPGAIAANMDVFLALVRTGDHVICTYPTYQQLYEAPASLGADVSLWCAQEDKGWQLDIEHLKGLIRPNTRLITIKSVTHAVCSYLSICFVCNQKLLSSLHQSSAEILSHITVLPLTCRRSLADLPSSNPNNPTGSILSGPLLQNLVEVASSHDPPIAILSDEVYRPMFHDPSLTPVSPLFPPSILSLNYELTIATGRSTSTL